jgi:hypothetical protein
MITVLHEQRETLLPRAHAEGQALWVERDEVERATGWAWKPEGLCRDDACVPLPRNAGIERDGMLDLAAAWRHMGHPVVHDDAGATWVLGTGSGSVPRRSPRWRRPISRCPTWRAGSIASPTTAAERSSSPPGLPGEGVALTCPCGSPCTTN